MKKSLGGMVALVLVVSLCFRNGQLWADEKKVVGYDVAVGTSWDTAYNKNLHLRGFTQFNVSYRSEGDKLMWCSLDKIELRGNVVKEKVTDYYLVSRNFTTLDNKDESFKCHLISDRIQITEKSTTEVCTYSFGLLDQRRLKDFDGSCIYTDIVSGKQSVTKFTPMTAQMDTAKYIDLDAPIEFPIIWKQ